MTPPLAAWVTAALRRAATATIHGEDVTIAWLGTPGLVTAAVIPHARPAAESSPDAAATTAMLCNRMPTTISDGARWATRDALLGSALDDVLARAVTEGDGTLLDAPDDSDPDVAAARDLLFADWETRTETPLLTTYRRFVAEHETAVDELAAAADDPERLASARGQLERIEAEWEAVGGRPEVEAAWAVLGRPGASTLGVAFSRARTALRLAVATATDLSEYHRTRLEPAGFDPAEDTSWTVVSVTVPGDIPGGVEWGLGDDSHREGDLVEAEVAVLRVRREWWDPDLLRRGGWTVEGEPLDDGGETGAGRLPGWMAGLLLVRRVAALDTSVAPDPAAELERDSEDRWSPEPSARTRAAVQRFRREVGRIQGVDITGTRQVQLVDQHDDPLGRATGTFRVANPRQAGPHGRALQTWSADAGGVLEVPRLARDLGEGREEDTGEVWLLHPGSDGITIDLAERASAVRVTLDPPLRIEVVTRSLLSGRAVPLRGARIQVDVSVPLPEFDEARVFDGRTDDDGALLLLRPCRVPWDATRLLVDARGYGTVAVRDPLAAADPPVDDRTVGVLRIELAPDEPHGPVPGYGGREDARVLGHVVERLGARGRPVPATPSPQ